MTDCIEPLGNQSLRRLLIQLPLLLSLIAASVSGIGGERAFLPHRPNSAFGFTNPYGLPWVENFQPGNYVSSRWGVWESFESEFIPQNSTITHFGPPYDKFQLRYTREWNKSPILNSILVRDLINLEYESFANVIGPTLSQNEPIITYSLDASFEKRNYHLLRPLNFRNLSNSSSSPFKALKDEFGQDVDADNLVILIHGWNRRDYDNPYTGSQWLELSKYLHVFDTHTPEWQMVKYLWADDAATGNDIPDRKKMFINGAEAAEIGLQHGVHMGESLLSRRSTLRRVHFIAHSAGAWVARAAAGYLVNEVSHGRSDPLEIQITLLDPFVPGALVGSNYYWSAPSSNRDAAAINRLSFYAGLSGSRYRIHRLENFFVRGDLSDLKGGTTSQEFNYPFHNSEIDNRLGETGHIIPIEYYAASADYDPSTTGGWRNSMFMNEPYFWRQPSSSEGVLQPGDSFEFNIRATTRHSDQTGVPAPLTYRWFRDGVLLEGSDPRVSGANSPTLVISNIGPEDAGNYHCEAEHAQLKSSSGEATLRVAGGSAPVEIHRVLPESLQALPVSQLQDLTIEGSGFGPSSTLSFTTPSGETIPSQEVRFVERTSTLIRYQIAVAGDSGTWSVRVNQGDRPSVPFSFIVAAGGGQASGPVERFEVSGPEYLEAGKSGPCSAIVHYADGTSRGVTASWSIAWGSGGAVSNNGLVTAANVASRTALALRAQFTSGGQSYEAFHTVQILAPSSGAPVSGIVGRELLRNGTFEQGATSWSLSGAVVSSGAFPFEGSRYAVLGETHNAVDLLSQEFSVPNSASKVELRLRLNISSEDHGAGANDTMAVFIEDPSSGSTVEVLQVFSNMDRSQGAGRSYYRLHPFDLSAHAGRTLRLKFAAITNATLSTTFRVDNVSIIAETTEASPVTSEGLSIDGPALVDESSTAQFSAYLIGSNGSKTPVQASWRTNSSRASIDSSGLLRTYSVRGDQRVTITATFQGDTLTRSASKAVVISDRDTAPQYVINASGSNGTVRFLPAGPSFPSGTHVNVVAYPDPGYEFVEWAGDLSGVGVRSFLRMDGNKSVVAHFRPLPPETGSVRVQIRPESAQTAGARWRLYGQPAWHVGETTLSGIPVGPQSVEFLTADGWSTPSSVSFHLAEGQTATFTGHYSVNSEDLVIESLQPRFGSLEGGTRVTIKGVNLGPNSEIRFGGIPAVEVEHIDASTLIATTPESPAYGTVDVSISGRTGEAVFRNAFTYFISQGEGMELVGQIGGAAFAVHVAGGFAYISEGAAMKVLDVSNKSAPALVGSVALPGPIRGLHRSGDHVFAACGEAGVQIVDVSEPQFPSLVSMVETLGRAESITGLESVVIVGDSGEGLVVIDGSDPTRPRRIAALPLIGSPINLALAASVSTGDPLVLVAAQSGGLHIVDLSEPRMPSLRATVSGIGMVFGISAHGRYAYAGSNTAPTGLHVIDLLNPGAPSLVANQPPNSMTAIATNGTALWGISSADLVTVNVSSPSSPIRQSNFPRLMGEGYRLQFVDGFIYATSSLGGLEIYSASNPLNPQYMGRYTPPFAIAQDVKISGNHAYVAASDKGLQIVNVSDPSIPYSEGGSVIPDAYCDRLEVSGNHVHLLRLDGHMETFNVSNPASPAKTSTLLGQGVANATFAREVVARGNWLFLGGQRFSPSESRLNQLSLADPGTPTLVGGISFPASYGSVSGVDSAGDRLFTSHFGGRIAVSSAPEGGALQEIGTFATASDRVYQVAANEDFAFLAAGPEGVRIFDIRNLSNPIPLPPILDESLNARSAVLRGDRLYIGGWFHGGVRVYDVSDPFSPALEAFHSTAGSTERLAVVGDLVYVADGFYGMTILRHLDTRAPEIEILSPTASDTHSTEEPLLALAGTASDDRAVARVTWSSSRGGGGHAVGTTEWSVPGIILQDGENLISVSAFDYSGNATTSTITVGFVDRRAIPTGPDSVSLSLGEEVNHLVTANNSPLRYESDDLPEGLQIDPETGLISGIPTTDGFYIVTIRIVNEHGSRNQLLSLEVRGPDAPGISPGIDSGRPDVAVGARLGRMRGNHVYGVIGPQSINLASRSARPVRGFATITNRGGVPDRFRVQASRGNRFFSLSFRSSSRVSVAALARGRHFTRLLEPDGAHEWIRIEVRPDRGLLTRRGGDGRVVRLRKRLNVMVRADATGSSSFMDRGRIRVQTR